LYEKRLAVAVKQHGELASATLPLPDQGTITRTEFVQVLTPTSQSLPPAVSEAVVERFTRRIQPILVNNCTTAGCHQPRGAQTLQLDRALLHGLSNRRTTMANLQAAFAQIDRAEPLNSPLLTVPRAAHGGLAQPVFGPSHTKLVEQLIEWVTLVSERQTDVPASDVSNPSTAKPEETPSLPTEAKNIDMSLAPARRPPRYGANMQAWQPKDAFDPQIFNRRIQGPSAIRSAN
jgi:hypothetical protein